MEAPKKEDTIRNMFPDKYVHHEDGKFVIEPMKNIQSVTIKWRDGSSLTFNPEGENIHSTEV